MSLTEVTLMTSRWCVLVILSLLVDRILSWQETVPLRTSDYPDIKYTFDSRLVNITFKPSQKNYSHYKVQLDGMTKTEGRYSSTVETQWPETLVSFKSNHLVNNTTYTIKIYPQKKIGSLYSTAGQIKRKSFFFDGLGMQCRDWSVGSMQDVNYYERSLKLLIYVKCPDVECFDYFGAELWNKVTECDGRTGSQFSRKNITKRASSNSQECTSLTEEITFRNLVPGNYCVRIYPYPPCLSGCVIYTQVVNFDSTQVTTPISVVNEEVQLNNSHYIWSVSLVIILPIVVVIIIWLIRHKREVVVNIHASYPEDEQLELTQTQKKVVAFLLYSHDSEFHKNAVCALARFLQHCWDIDVILDIDWQYIICFDKETWIANNVRYPCDKRGEALFSNVDKKLIIVESEGAVKQQESRMDGNILNSMNSSLESVFITALCAIMSDFERCTNDYCHIFVVHLNYTPNRYKLDYIVPNRRYFLPDHFTDLYNDLFSNSGACSSNSNLHTFWLQHPSYKKFLQYTEQENHLPDIKLSCMNEVQF